MCYKKGINMIKTIIAEKLKEIYTTVLKNTEEYRNQ